MKKEAVEKNTYVSISLIGVALLILISLIMVFLYFYGGFKDLAEYLFWIKRKIDYIF